MKLAGIAYVSPTFRFDAEAKIVVVQYRNTATGEVMRQSPSDKELRRRADAVTVDAVTIDAQAMQAAQSAAEQRIVATVAVAPPGASSEAPSPLRAAPSPAEMPAAAPKVAIDV